MRTPDGSSRGGTALLNDYDFRLAQAHFRGNGWRGLAALVIALIVRGAIVAAIAFSAKSGGISLMQLIERLV
jgi:hypothetical protein